MTLMRTISCLALLVATAFCQPQAAVMLDGGNGNTVTLSRQDLAKLPSHTVSATDHGTPATFEGVLVSDLLAKVQAPLGDKLHGKALAAYVLVEAADGYRAVFSMAEMDPALSDKRVYLAASRDGKPLSEKEGPFRIVVPDEKRPARWVRQVTALKIREAQ